MGEGMAGGVVAEWYQPDGSTVSTGDPICRIECEFVAFDVEAEQPGLLRHQRPTGSIEKPGVILGLILAPEESATRGSAMPPLAEPVLAEEVPLDEAIAGFDDSGESPLSDSLDEPEDPAFEAIVVPFPRRFADVPAVEWDEAPGDAVDFESGFFSGKPDPVTEALVVPGGSIPGLALWEAETESTIRDLPELQNERYARISAEAAASAQVLTVSVCVNLMEARNLVAACTRAWTDSEVGARIEDVVFRAIAYALENVGMNPGPGALVIAEDESDVSSALAAPMTMTLREAVATRATGGDATFEDAEWVLVSLANLGVTSATPRLDGGRSLSFALASEDEHGVAGLTMSYDSSRWSEGGAARLLVRVQELAETPYAMLV